MQLWHIFVQLLHLCVGSLFLDAPLQLKILSIAGSFALVNPKKKQTGRKHKNFVLISGL